MNYFDMILKYTKLKETEKLALLPYIILFFSDVYLSHRALAMNSCNFLKDACLPQNAFLLSFSIFRIKLLHF